jgi:hypothetical protein
MKKLVALNLSPQGNCDVERRGSRRAANVRDILKPATASPKQPSSKRLDPKKTGGPTAGVKFPASPDQPPSKQPLGSGKRR